MANPFSSLGSVPIMEVIQDTLLRQQKLQIGSQAIQANDLDLQLKRQQMELQNRYRDQQLNGVLLDPTRENNDTSSINQSSASVIPEDKVVADLRRERAEAWQNVQQRQAVGLDYKPWLTRMDSLDRDIREATKDANKTRADRSQQAANVLRDVNSTEGLQEALSTIGEQFGEGAMRAIDRKLPHDDYGNPIWNETAKQALTPYVSQFTTMHEKAMQNYRGNEVAIQAERLAQKVKEDNETKRYHDQEIAVRQAGIAAANQRAKMVMERAGMGMDYKLTKDTQGQIDKIADQYKIRDYQKSFEVADNTEAKITDPQKGYASVTAPEARTLADQFKLMIDNYRSRTGGKYQEAELSRMNGLLQRLDKFTETIGEGDKLLAKDVMLQTTRQMKALYADRATDLAKEELQRAKTLKDRGGNPMWLNLHTDVDNLERLGKVKKVEANGKPYVLFPKAGTENKKKKGPEDFDAIEMPTAPESKAYPVLIEGER